MIQLPNPNKLQHFISTNPNTLYGMDQRMLRVLSNGNCQFITDLSRQLQIGYSVPALAMHISHSFFSKMCYINYDRFLILTASLLIALKVKDICIPIKKVCNAFYSVIMKLNKSLEPYSEKKYELVRDEICKVESLLYRVLEYGMDFRLPLEFVDRYCKELIPKDRCGKVFFTCRVLIVDSYRTFVCMLFNPLVIFVACLLITCRYEKLNFLEAPFVRNQPGVTVEHTEEQLYHRLLETISALEQLELRPEDVRDCIAEMNRLHEIFHEYQTQQMI